MNFLYGLLTNLIDKYVMRGVRFLTSLFRFKKELSQDDERVDKLTASVEDAVKYKNEVQSEIDASGGWDKASTGLKEKFKDAEDKLRQAMRNSNSNIFH